MSQREQVIRAAAADWASDKRTAQSLQMEQADVAIHIETATKDANSAFNELKKSPVWKNVGQHKNATQEFLQAALPYFRLRIGDGPQMVTHQLQRLSEHASKWASYEDELAELESFIAVGEWLRSNPALFSLLRPVLEVRATSLDQLKTKIKGQLILEGRKEFDAQFGSAPVYEALGKRMAIEQFIESKPAKMGRKTAPLNNKDLFRALEFDQLVIAINQRLTDEDYSAATGEEVCRATLAAGFEFEDFDREDDLRWLYEDYFGAANITAAGFLNSVSRGRTSFATSMKRFLVLDSSDHEN